MAITLDTSALSAIAGAIVGAGAAATVIWVRMIRPMHEAQISFTQFIEDWRGEPGRPGVRSRPGVMERLDGIETTQVDQGSRLARVEQELKANGGNSLRDEVKEIRAQVGALTARPVIVQLAATAPVSLPELAATPVGPSPDGEVTA